MGNSKWRFKSYEKRATKFILEMQLKESGRKLSNFLAWYTKIGSHAFEIFKWNSSFEFQFWIRLIYMKCKSRHPNLHFQNVCFIVHMLKFAKRFSVQKSIPCFLYFRILLCSCVLLAFTSLPDLFSVVCTNWQSR